jgi:acyl transferase domain-containing protein
MNRSPVSQAFRWPRVEPMVAGVGRFIRRDAARHPLLESTVDPLDAQGVVLNGRLSVRSHPWLADHLVMGSVVLPGTAMLELALRAGEQIGYNVVERLTLPTPLVLPEPSGVVVQVAVGASDQPGRRSVTVQSRAEGTKDGPWSLHARGVLAAGGRPAALSELTVWPPAGAVPVDLNDLYARFTKRGLVYGRVFQGLRAVWFRGEEVFAEVVVPTEQQDDAARFEVHPALLDAALHPMGLVNLWGSRHGGQAKVPFIWNGVGLGAAGASVLRVRLVSAGADALSLAATDGSGAPVITVDSLTVRPVTAEQLRDVVQGRLALCRVLVLATMATAEPHLATAMSVPRPAPAVPAGAPVVPAASPAVPPVGPLMPVMSVAPLVPAVPPVAPLVPVAGQAIQSTKIDIKQQSAMQQSSLRRDAERARFSGSEEQFLRSLDLVMRIDRAREENLRSIEELTAYACRMHATGVACSSATLHDLLADRGHEILVASLSDRFGSHGAVGVVVLEKHPQTWHVTVLAASSRAMGFGAGTVIVCWLTDQAARGKVHLVADFRPTGHNRIMEIAFRFAGFDEVSCACQGVLGDATDLADLKRLHLRPTRQATPVTMRLVAPDLA